MNKHACGMSFGGVVSAALIGLFTSSTPIVQAEDWPQWRGPGRDGKSSETGLLQQWPEGGPKLLWQSRDAGSGYSTPSVVGGQLYVISNDGLDNEYVLGLSVKDGKEVWKQQIGKVGNPNQQPSYPASRSTPTVDGDVLYALSSDGDLACLETATGKVRWAKNLREEFKGVPGRWAYAESPLVDGDKLICSPGGSEATIVALNKGNGDVIWKCAVPGGDEAAYSSAIIIDALGVKQCVQFLQNGLIGVNAESGEFLWRYDRTAQGSPAVIGTPVADGPHIYSAAARAGGGVVELQKNDGKFTVEELYFSAKNPAGVGGVVKIGDHLYGAANAMMCFDFMSGEIKWEERAIGAASLCFADNRLYLHGESGEVALVEPTAEAYRELGRFTPPNQPDRGHPKAMAWAYPVIANGRLYLRDAGSIWCFDIRANSAAAVDQVLPADRQTASK